ncbi:hypothetical protein ACI79C_05130 [Geodermatophilus sp. SYSU D00697]
MSQLTPPPATGEADRHSVHVATGEDTTQVDRAPRTARGRVGTRRALVVLLVAALLVLPALGAALESASQPPVYAIQVEFLHEPSDTATVDSITRQLATHAVLITRRDFLQGAADAVGRAPQELFDSVSAEPVEDSSVLRVQVLDPLRARGLATADYLVSRYAAQSTRIASFANHGTVTPLGSPEVLPDPVSPQPLRAAAGGLLVGILLTVALLTLLRMRRQRSGYPGS